MAIAILSNIHGNLPALEAVLEDARSTRSTALATSSATARSQAQADVIVWPHAQAVHEGDRRRALRERGSVGKPKDGDWRACYALMTLQAQPSIQFIRAPYNVGRIASAIRKADLPNEFATDVETGGALTSPPRPVPH